MKHSVMSVLTGILLVLVSCGPGVPEPALFPSGGSSSGSSGSIPSSGGSGSIPSSGSGWTSGEISSLTNQCRSAGLSRSVCSCAVEKLQLKYPTSQSFLAAGSQAQKEIGYIAGKECAKSR